MGDVEAVDDEALFVGEVLGLEPGVFLDCVVEEEGVVGLHEGQGGEGDIFFGGVVGCWVGVGVVVAGEVEVHCDGAGHEELVCDCVLVRLQGWVPGDAAVAGGGVELVLNQVVKDVSAVGILADIVQAPAAVGVGIVFVHELDSFHPLQDHPLCIVVSRSKDLFRVLAVPE